MFPLSPRVAVFDVGGNLLKYDSTSVIRARIFGVLPDVSLGPSDALAVQLEEGVATFSGLRINKPGNMYSIFFDLFAFAVFAHNFSYTNISVQSPYFSVMSGPVRLLKSFTYAGNAWAGGQPFLIQPAIAVSDFGGYPRNQDFSTGVSCSLVPSLAVGRYVVIDTFNITATNNVSFISLNVPSGTYGVGQAFIFSVVFDYPITVKGLPYLSTSALSAQGGQAFARFDLLNVVENAISFQYIVQDGDTSANFNYLGQQALVLNGSTILDFYGSNVNTTLPEPAPSFIMINSTPPFITEINLSVVDGEYGAGQVIDFFVTYSVPVIVKGIPTFNLSGITISSCPYIGSSNNSETLNFQLFIKPGERLTHLTLFNSTIDIPDNSSIKCLSTFPSLSSNNSLAHLAVAFAATYNITIDTSAPRIDGGFGLQSPNSSGVYLAGDTISLCFKFTKQVVIDGHSITLEFNCGPQMYPCYALVNNLSSDRKTICFSLRVPSNANTTFVQLNSNNALFVGNEDYIRRSSTFPLTPANLSTSVLSQLRLNFSLYGFPSKITTVVVVPPYPSVLYPDDVIVIRVEFDLNVSVNCIPVFQLNIGGIRLALYSSGSRSRNLYFIYKVQLGDSSNGLFYPRNALCADFTCSRQTSCSIMTLSTSPVLQADLSLPSPNRYTNTLLANVTLTPTTSARNTSVVNISCSHFPSVVAPGEEVVFNVYFSDAIYLSSTLPLLFMNTGHYATLTKVDVNTLSFAYIVQVSDANVELNIFSIISTNSALVCLSSESCSIRNALGQAVNLTTSGINFLSGIVINTSPPYVVSLLFLNDTSVIYTAGDVVSIGILFDRPVAVEGTDPWLAMSLNRNDDIFRFAKFKYARDNLSLIFDLLVQVGDNSVNLSCNGSNALNFLNPTSHIYALSSQLTTLADLALPYTAIGHSSPIIVDAVTVPEVINVSCMNSSGKYAPGDMLLFEILFSLNVSVNGNSYFNLNVGPQLAQAVFIFVGTPSNKLYYSYTVATNESTSFLDYADEFSLFPGYTNSYGAAYVRRSSENPLINADLRLPSPGSPGSISHSSEIIIDGVAPYMTSVFIKNPDGNYGLKDTIVIGIQFSAPVVVVGGFPVIYLNIPKRYAKYTNGSGSNILFFEYFPQPGDTAMYLDYYSGPSLLFSTSEMFSYSGSRVLAMSVTPTLDAEVHFNPPGGYLTGSTIITADAGVASFLDLSITRPGPSYRLNFVIDGTMLRTFQDVNVSISSEFELRPNSGKVLDQIGGSVAIDGTNAVIGAPNTALPDSVTTEVQTITTSAIYSSESLLDIQLVETRATPQPSIQQFHTTGAVGSNLGGYYSILMGFYGPSRPIPYNADPAQINAFLAFDMPELGNVSASKEKYYFCACEGAYLWTLTFNDLTTGTVLPITLDGSLLTGNDAQIIGPSILQEPALLRGTFTLSLLGLITPPIAFNAGVDEMTAAIMSLGFGVKSISITPSDTTGARGWFITFSVHSTYIPELSANSSGLFGANQIEVWTDKLQNATYGSISGNFILTWRGNSTVPLPFNATASEMQSVLEALPVIGSVTVYRCCETAAGGFTWTVTFNQVKSYTIGGYVVDATGPLDLINATSNLIGNDAIIKVTEARQGTTGEGAGVAYVYELIDEVWKNTFIIRGNDTSQSDNFGCSVSIADDLILIGAKGSSKKNKAAVQAITCIADSGNFGISFRGWISSPIPWNVTALELQNIFLSNANADVKSPGLNAVIVGNWGLSGLCDNNTAFLTFTQPIFGSSALGPGGLNLELLSLSFGSLRSGNNSSNVTLSIQSVQDQVIRSPSDPLQQGSAYLFRKHLICTSVTNTTCIEPTWVQEAEFYPPYGTGFERFGIAVAVSDEVLAIGCPGFNQEMGAVFVYRKNYDNIGWIFSQRLTVSYLVAGDQFGYSLAMNNGTLIVGAPFRNSGNGEVFCFRLYGTTNIFIFFQDISLPSIFSKKENDYFGWSVALSGNTLVTSAIGRDEATIYLGLDINEPATDAGAVYVFQREIYEAEFLFEQKLSPTNVRIFDRFGYSVAIDGDILVASSLEDYTGVYLPSKAIYSVMTTGVPYRNISGYFTLTWDGYSTRPLPHNISAYALQNSIESDLNTGKVLVSRSPQNLVTSGYTWSITFVAQTTNVTTLTAEWSNLFGHNASVVITLTSPSPLEIRAVTHIFKKDSSKTPSYIEEIFLSPYSHQPIDLCGYSVAISKPFALVGCPNRDVTLIPNNNTGSAFSYNLNILDFQFTSYSYEVVEGEPLSITVIRTPTSSITACSSFYLETIDRVATSEFQEFIRGIYGIRHQDVTYPSTYADASGCVGTARGRNTLSKWLDGYYDFKALSDFQMSSLVVEFTPTTDNVSLIVMTNDDTVLELPNENFSSVIHSPGVWPSLLGKLISVSTILDNHNGFYVNTSTTVYDKLYDETDSKSFGVGSEVTILEYPGILATSAPLMPFSTLIGAGAVFIYVKVFDIWIQSSKIFSPVPTPNGRFGDCVALSFRSKHNTTLLAIGEPGSNSVYVFMSSDGGYEWTVEHTFHRTEVDLPQYEFGQRGTIAWGADVLAVGVPLLETVYFYRRVAFSASVISWDNGVALKSSDFSYDVIFGQIVLHHQYFGASVAISQRTMVVGSPFGNYYSTGDGLPGANIDTAGINAMSSSKGKVYLFYSQPSIQRITIHSTIPLREGTFTISLDYKGINVTTEQIAFNASGAELSLALNALENLDTVISEYRSYRDREGNFLYTWTITFSEEWQDVPSLSCNWNGYGCNNCSVFDGLFNSSYVNSSMISADVLSNYSDFIEYSSISASDGRSGDRFGSMVAIDGDQLAVSAYYSASVTTSTWDFENGTLEGWSMTGTAFLYQPTYGDNTYYRGTYPNAAVISSPGSGQTCNLEGRYFVGTFEKRPGNPNNLLVPDIGYSSGNSQGDEPVGTLTSQVFMIKGNFISLLVGGGCNERLEYVELIIDGFSVARVTGQCNEKMNLLFFNTTEFLGRAGQIRIVDASSGKWGHINVDYIRFSWSVDGSLIDSVYAPYSGGMVETPLSGAVYVYKRYSNDLALSICLEDVINCPWVFEARLTPSDKRSDVQFGTSLKLSEKYGLLVVGAPSATETGIYKELLESYPSSNISVQQYPLDPRLVYSEQRSYLHSGAVSVWYEGNEPVHNATSLQSGAVYVFAKIPAKYGQEGLIGVTQHWHITETVKFQPSEVQAGDFFGFAAALDGIFLAVGSPGQDATHLSSGAVYFINLSGAMVSFLQAEYIVSEASTVDAKVIVYRDATLYDGDMYVDYATSDLSAKGVNDEMYLTCMAMSPYHRGLYGCGNYRRVQGTLFIPRGYNFSGFTVPLINDDCLSRFPKYIQLNLYVTGSAVFAGQATSAVIRIDDDDFDSAGCIDP